MNVELTPIAVPADAAALDAPAAADFIEMTRIRNVLSPILFGNEQGNAVTAEQMLPRWQGTADEQIDGSLIRVDGSVVGRTFLSLPMEAGSQVAQLHVDVLPEHWGHGIGPVVATLMEDRAREHGRTVLQVWSGHTRFDDPPYEPATGVGSVPRDNATRFLLRQGYSLEQVYRASALDLREPHPRIDELLAEARAAASGYRYVSWMAPTPPQWRDDYAYLKSRMSTDAPSGDLDVDEEAWDADRVVRLEDVVLAQGYTILVGAAQHIASGRLVAFTELAVLGEHSGNTDQFDTLVQADHRGHRLGMLVKGETLARWRELVPESPMITTNNAEENRPMLAVNEAMGFIPVQRSGAWQKRLTDKDAS